MSKYALHFFASSLLILSGCGGAPPSGQHSKAANKRFDNPALQSQWEAAKQAIGTQQFDLNAAIAPPYGTAPHDWRTPDPRALTIEPDGLDVVLVPDLTLDQLKAENGPIQNGVIHAPDGASARYCHGYLMGNTVYIAASGADSFAEWEFENWILAHWYSVAGR